MSGTTEGITVADRDEQEEDETPDLDRLTALCDVTRTPLWWPWVDATTEYRLGTTENMIRLYELAEATPWLLAEVRRLQARIAELERQLADRRTERGIWRDEEAPPYLAHLAGGVKPNGE